MDSRQLRFIQVKCEKKLFRLVPPAMNSARVPFILAATIAAISSKLLAQGYAPADAVKKMKVADGFEVKLVASEPMVRQPVCIEFDDRGRLWTIQYLQYPNPAGLKRVKVDRYSRTVYDKVPEPPPRGPKGADRITILEDTDGDGAADKAHDFVNGLNLATGIAFGHGGVFVLQVPYLLFYPDKNGDDIPDGDPEVCLTGFGMEDAHSVANSLMWGPDGWLYGCQGSTVTANIRGIEFQQGVWRYHPITKRFELFCEGGGNSWGLDFDKDGNLIYATNFGGYRGLHGVQGGYYWKSFGKHGALHNPYTYGYFEHMPHDNFVGGHVTVGGMIYQSEGLPEAFRNTYIHVDTLGHAIHWNKILPFGSSFQTKHGGTLVDGNDSWFAPTDLTISPDGALYFSDWYDKRTAHPDPDADWDTTNGRIYRLQAKGTNSVTLPDFKKAKSDDLIGLLSSKNDWIVRRARRGLADRRDVTVYPKLRAQVFDAKDEHLSLESLWALHVSGGADEAFLNDCLDHSSANIRRWAVRLLGDQTEISPTTAEHLLKIAEKDSDITVRSQLACTAKRIPAKAGLFISSVIAQRDVDVKDPHIPMLLWWTVEKNAAVASKGIVDLFASAEGWRSGITRETILPRAMRRFATEGSGPTLEACARILETSPQTERDKMIVALEQGFSEQPKEKRLSDLNKLPASLKNQLVALWKDDTTDTTIIRLLARLNFAPAKGRALALATTKATSQQLRLTMLQTLGETGEHTSDLLKIVSAPDESNEIKIAALGVLQQADSADVTPALLGEYSKFNEPVRNKTRDVLLGRKSSALAFLQQINSGKVSAKEIPLDQVRQVSLHQDKQLDDLVRKFWGNISSGTPEEKLADIRRFNNDLRAASGDAARGHEVFLKTCSVCHELYGEGEKVGPELTHANRQDKDFLLASIVDPSAVIRKEFLNYSVELSDGRVISGVIVEQSASSLTVAGARNERTTVSRDKVVSIQESSVSLMPEGLLHPLTPQERRDLFAYLQSTKPVEIKKAEAPRPPSAHALEKIKVTGQKFVGSVSGKEFTPIGFNYDRDYKSRLLEDYWATEWQTVTEDFKEMKALGANIVRIHLQLSKFMETANKPNEESLKRLAKLVSLAEETGLYLDVTGLACYRKADVPAWYDSTAENERWTAQANFWRAVAKTCANSPAVFCYDLVNEPVFPAEKMKDWLHGELGGFVYGQTVTRDPTNRSRPEIARQWTAKLVSAIRESDQQTSITIGLLPWEGADTISTLASQLDYISFHIYPKSGKLDEDLQTAKTFSVGKPVVIEELFPMNCNSAQLRDFIEQSRQYATGWISFYWGQTPEQLRNATTISDAVLRDWLQVFPTSNRTVQSKG